MDFGKLLLQFLSILSGDRVKDLAKYTEVSLENTSVDWRKQTMKLSKNFFLDEFIKSRMAVKLNIDNSPSEKTIENLQRLCEQVLQKVRNFHGPVHINSGYRSKELNAKVGGSVKSQHCKGEAADIEVVGHDNLDIFNFIRKNLEYDQVILEFYEPGKFHSGWIHVSYRKTGNRNQSFKAIKHNGKTKYVRWV
jgi:hypothetical protein